ncbi:electron transport complex protein RnfD [Candidatus Termititenax persephonae]|uniref:Ion-translocating oxidoreductase complex subunit D n=1 Tax=Candidatus Termititenax persephonae TaxID=2218525 RepID=A0A388TGB9_9BACT|nr:electron transport complex protein RnfD [Candidatus Termititenax persephonae]
MRDVLIALLPAGLASLVFFGWRAVWLIGVCVGAAVLTEYLAAQFFKKKNYLNDCSAVVTGVLLAFVLPPSLPLWMAALGAVFAILLVKELFGGLGHNIFNPALGGRAFLLASFPVWLTTWTRPFDAVTTATPLALAKSGQLLDAVSRATVQASAAGQAVNYWDLFLGNVAGSLGETSALALLLGAAYLLYRQVIDWRIPLGYLGTVALFMFFAHENVAFHLLAGGLLLGAFFMATDYTTSPMTRRGKWIFAIGCGILTSVIRLWGGYPEGVCYSILIMNMFVPLLDRLDEAKSK